MPRYAEVIMYKEKVAEFVSSIIGMLHDAIIEGDSPDEEGAVQLLINVLNQSPEAGNEKLSSSSQGVIASQFAMQQLIFHAKGDLQAILKNDPSCDPDDTLSPLLVFHTHLPYFSVMSYRISNPIKKLGYPFTASLIATLAKEKTGVEISPGATIGERFFIDHGVGTVIGGASIIGDDVKIFHMVTIGSSNPIGLQETALESSPTTASKAAISTRHPTIKANTIIYAGAIVLGGQTEVGENSVVGANSYIQDSKLGDNVQAGACVRIKKSNIGGDSVVKFGQHVNSSFWVRGTNNFALRRVRASPYPDFVI